MPHDPWKSWYSVALATPSPGLAMLDAIIATFGAERVMEPLMVMARRGGKA